MTLYTVKTQFTDGSQGLATGLDAQDVFAAIDGTLANIPFDSMTITREATS